VSYQLLDGRRVRVASRYALKSRSSSKYGFALGAYERSRPVVIDPGLAYSTFLGGPSFESGTAVTVDRRGNAYLTGITGSANFPTSSGAFDSTLNGGGDAFVTKLNPVGSGLVYSTFLGGAITDEGSAIAVDRRGNVYLSGTTDSANFPTTPGAFDTSFNGFVDAFVAKLNPAGSGLVYSTFLGGTTSDLGRGVAVDTRGNAYLAGLTTRRTSPPPSVRRYEPQRQL
jgi:hypothetical protein